LANGSAGGSWAKPGTAKEKANSNRSMGKLGSKRREGVVYTIRKPGDNPAHFEKSVVWNHKRCGGFRLLHLKNLLLHL